MPVPFLDLSAQYRSIKKEMDPAIQQVIDTNAFALGPAVERFEQNFAAYCDTKHAVGLASGTAALELLLRAYNIGSGDEVITVANSFFATAEAIALVGAMPVLVDCREDDALIDVTLIEKVITKKTKAIIPVDLYGQCADMDAVNAIAKKHNLIVIEDACQAHGSTYKGKRAGSLSAAGAFSFYPGKNLGAFGEAGAITTNDAEITTKVRMLREHGMPEKYLHTVLGRNDRMDGIQGAVLDVKLKHLDEWNKARRMHASLYRSLLKDESRIKLFTEHPDREQNYHLFVVRVQNRDAVQKKLKDAGISTGIHYPVPIHKQKAAIDGGYSKGNFPIADKISSEILSLPMFAELTETQIKEVCDALKRSL
jgi:dTDP-4-amino-4,6-dideoxygalactose transaminase